MKKILRLRRILPSDRKYFLKWWTDKELIALTSGRPVEPVENLSGYFAQLLKKEHNYLITADGKVVGHVMLIRRGKNAFGFPIVIGESKYRGRGFGSQAIRKILRIGFEKLGYKKASLEVRPENLRAIRTYAALGFRSRGVRRRRNQYQPRILVMTLSRRQYIRTAGL